MSINSLHTKLNTIDTKDFPKELLSHIFSIINTLHDNIAILDAQGVLRWVSDDFLNTYNLKHEDVIGTNTLELERKKIFSPSVASLVLQSKQQVTVIEKTKDGRQFIATAIPIYGKNGEIKWIFSYTINPKNFLSIHSVYKELKLTEHDDNKELQLENLILQSKSIQKILHLIPKIANIDTNILVTGESGTGKTAFARLIHAQKTTPNTPFVEINCAEIPIHLLESELFGYETGAFTGAKTQGKIGRIQLAHKGTLFLDEIGELPLETQAKLLQVIQEKKITRLGGTKSIFVDFRLIAATNQNLLELVEKKLFRKDLYFRLNVLPLYMPSLKERREDIIPLAQKFLNDFNLKYKTNKIFSASLEDILEEYSYPGNIRELKNLIEQLVIVTDDVLISEIELPKNILLDHFYTPKKHKTLKETLEDLEAQIIMKTYKNYKTTTATAKELGISQATATRKIQKYLKSK